MSRKTITALLIDEPKPTLHFTGGLRGESPDTWHPVSGDLFATIERLMVASGDAHNVARIERVREVGKAIDYLVTYNVQEGVV